MSCGVGCRHSSDLAEAVAVAVAGSCSSDQTPSLRTSICHRCIHKKKGKGGGEDRGKERQEKGRKKNYDYGAKKKYIWNLILVFTKWMCSKFIHDNCWAVSCVPGCYPFQVYLASKTGVYERKFWVCHVSILINKVSNKNYLSLSPYFSLNYFWNDINY